MGIAPEPPRTPPWAPTLTDGVVTLRAHRDADVPDIVAHCSDPLMARWTRVPSPYTAGHAAEFVATRRAEWESMRELGFAIEHEGRYAGSVDLRPAEGQTAEVGYALAPWARGRGAMTASMRLVLPWAFDQLGLSAVHWRARVGNWSSRRVAWAAGFRVEGRVRRLLASGDVAHDAWVGSLLRGDALRPAHVWLTPPALIGSTVLLRAHRPQDAPRIVEACTDASTQQWLPLIPSPYGHGDAMAHLEQLMSEQAVGEALSWVVADPGSDLLLGEIGVFGLGGGTGRYGEIGYWTHPQARGQGLTTEALRLVARHSLLPLIEGGLGLPRVVVRAARGNVASQRVALNAGFRPAGVDRAGEVLRDGSVQDLLRFDLLPDELPVPVQRSPQRMVRGADAPLTPPRLVLPGGATTVLDREVWLDTGLPTGSGDGTGPSRAGTVPGNGAVRGSTGSIPILGIARGRRAAARKGGTRGEPDGGGSPEHPPANTGHELPGPDDRTGQAGDRSGPAHNRAGPDVDRAGRDHHRAGQAGDRTSRDHHQPGQDGDGTGPGSDPGRPRGDRSGMGSDRSGMGSDRSGMGSDRSGMGSDRSGMGSDRSDVRGDRSDVRGDRSDVGSDRSGVVDRSSGSDRSSVRDRAGVGGAATGRGDEAGQAGQAADGPVDGQAQPVRGRWARAARHRH